MAGSCSGPSVSSSWWYYMNLVDSEKFPTSPSIMPFFDMFKPKRSRSRLSGSERFSDDSELYDQAPGYGPRPTSNLGSGHTAPVHRSQLYPNSRVQHHPRHGSTHRSHSSGSERYAQPGAQDRDQSWYRVERPNYHQGPHDDYYSEDGDRHSDTYGAAPVHLISESSRVDSPVPSVHRQGAPGPGSRLYEQFAESAGLPPSSVTRVDLHDLHEDVPVEDYEGFDHQPQRSASTHSNPLYHAPASHQPLTQGPQRRPHRRSQPHAFQGVHLGPTSDSSRSDVVQALDNGDRITIPRHSPDRGRSTYGSHGRSANLERTYYIVPPGMNVIFRDEYGNELKRVGDFSNDGPYEYDEAPVEIADERGRIVYKTGENYTDDGLEASEATYRDRPKIVHLGQYVSNGSVFFPIRVDHTTDVLIDHRLVPKQLHNSAVFVPSNRFSGPARLSSAHTIGTFRRWQFRWISRI
ncbi:hypothetical protein EDB83DRAFT_1712876 [Lactarius deliciosus]|nr:hypothetical protein EDB83DRAFT_1712876 [Lactarius deliciosus]